jgi:DNA-binding NarL/FixJ family response regulator
MPCSSWAGLLSPHNWGQPFDARDGKLRAVTTRIAIVEDDPKYRTGLAALLSAELSFAVADTFPAASPLLTKLVDYGDGPPWDLVIMDLGLPDMSGIDAIRRVKQRFPRLPIVAFTVFEEAATILDAICAGADGYLLKRTPADELITQLQAVVAGGSPLTPDVARIVLEVVRRHESEPGAPEPERHLAISGRERDVLRLLAEGMVHKQVADQLGISLDTVRTYVRRIYEKLQVKTVAQAVSRAIREQLI